MRDDDKIMRTTNWRRSAKSVRPKAIWIEGNGEPTGVRSEYASISDCPPGTTMFETREALVAEYMAALGNYGSTPLRQSAIARVTGQMMPPV
jgi:hypothetical protein